MIFDTEKLHQQLSDLLQLYLKRVADPDAVRQCSAKDALACAKALTTMMSDLQSGKLKSRSGDLQTATPLISRPGGRESVTMDGGTGDSPVIIPNKSRASEPGVLNEESRPTESSRYSLPATGYSHILEDSLNAVLSTDQESHLEEPYQRFIARADRLCKEVRQRLDSTQSHNQKPATKNQTRAAPRCPT